MRLPSHAWIRCKVTFLAVIMFFTSLFPARSSAFLGFGDISHDPLLMAGMFGQTGAQISQLVQMYYLFVEMRDRVGTLKNFKDWKGLAKRLLRKELENCTQRILADFRKRGGRISSETPTNPVLAAMITGRRRMNQMAERVDRGTFLADAYSSSDWSVANMDREAQLKRAQAQREAAEARDPQHKGGRAIALDGEAYDSRPNSDASAQADEAKDNANSSAFNLYGQKLANNGGGDTSSGSGTPSTGTSNQSPNDSAQPQPQPASIGNSTGSDGSSAASRDASSGNTAKKLNKLVGKMGETKEDGSLPLDEEAIQASKDSLKDGYVNGNGFANPIDPDTGKAVTDPKLVRRSSVKARQMMQQASEMLDQGVLEEYDAAVKFVDKQNEALSGYSSALSQRSEKGPEPYLAHMIAQNDTLIGMYGFTIRAERTKEEAAQVRRELERARDNEYRYRGMYKEGVKAAQSAGYR